MTLQWAVIAFLLYTEILVILLLLLPWIRPHLWKKFFNSRFVHSIDKFMNVYTYASIVVLLLLFFDAIREVQKYSHIEIKSEATILANADAVIHMRLFRAQRNLYISGFVLLLFLIIKRMAHLLARCAYLEAAAEAAMKQAEGASMAAKNLMGTSDKKGDGKSDEKWANEKEQLLKKLKDAEADRDTMKVQSENLSDEYNRVCDQLQEYQSKGTGSGNKKAD